MNLMQLIGLFFIIFVLVGCEQTDPYQETKEQRQLISNRIVQESINRYEFVKKSKNPLDACLQAGMVKQTMLAVQDETGYLKWETIEKDDCKKAVIHN